MSRRSHADKCGQADSWRPQRITFLRVAENKRPIGKTEPGSGQFENVILFSSELILPGG